MTNRPKQIGTAGESAVVKAATAYNIPARRVPLAGADDMGDVWLWPHGAGARVVVEVKAGEQTRKPSWTQIEAWWTETRREFEHVPGAVLPVLVLKRHGSGNAADWHAYTDWPTLAALVGGDSYADGWDPRVCFRLGDLFDLLHYAGVGV